MSLKSLKGIRILIVDDDQNIRETLSILLSLDGAIISEASDGNIAYDMIQNYDYNIIISDIRMPVCSGVELLNKVKKAKNKIPPILLMSAFTDISTAKAKELGAKGMFLKDSDSKYLKEMILQSAKS